MELVVALTHVGDGERHRAGFHCRLIGLDEIGRTRLTQLNLDDLALVSGVRR